MAESHSPPGCVGLLGWALRPLGEQSCPLPTQLPSLCEIPRVQPAAPRPRPSRKARACSRASAAASTSITARGSFQPCKGCSWPICSWPIPRRAGERESAEGGVLSRVRSFAQGGQRHRLSALSQRCCDLMKVLEVLCCSLPGWSPALLCPNTSCLGWLLLLVPPSL